MPASAGDLKIPCTAPGTPYSYGPPTTVGTLSKLKIGGGEDTCHSSVSERHGFAGAFGPATQLATMFHRNTSIDAPSTNADSEMNRFQPANCSE